MLNYTVENREIFKKVLALPEVQEDSRLKHIFEEELFRATFKLSNENDPAGTENNVFEKTTGERQIAASMRNLLTKYNKHFISKAKVYNHMFPFYEVTYDVFNKVLENMIACNQIGSCYKNSTTYLYFPEDLLND